MPKYLPSPEVLRKLLRYEPKTGKLFWRRRTEDFFSEGKQSAKRNCAAWNARYAGREAFTASDRGYKQGSVFNRNMRAHRAIWAIMTGAYPDQDVDHIDMDKGNNKWSNLRAATRSENKRNVGLRPDNKSGFKGVWFKKTSGKWVAELALHGKKYYFGLYEKKEEAAAVLTKKRKELHGDFSR